MMGCRGREELLPASHYYIADHIEDMEDAPYD